MQKRLRRLSASIPRSAAALCVLALCAFGVFGGVGASPAAAQEPAGSAATAREARSAAEAARRASERAAAELEQARDELKRAETKFEAARGRLERAETPEVPTAAETAQGAQGVEGAQAETAAPTSAELEELRARVEEAQETAERAQRQAEAAEARAKRALAELAELRERLAYDRTGAYLGGGGFWMPQDINASDEFDVDNSRGAMGRVGYRVHPHVALEARFDLLDDFDFRESTLEATLNGYSVTGNARVFILTSRVQPWVGVGGGVIQTNLKVRDASTGSRVDVEGDGKETDGLFRLSGGLDVYLTPYLVLSLEAAYAQVLGDRDAVAYGQLGGGLDLRF